MPKRSPIKIFKYFLIVPDISKRAKMSTKDKEIATKIKQAAYFDFKKIYAFAYEWLVEEDFKVIEKKYQEKIAGNTKDIEIVWDCSKEISDYFKFLIRIEWRILKMEEVEVVVDNKKTKTNKGEFEMKATGVLERDYESRWENTAFLKFLRGVYDRYVIRGTISAEKKKLIEDVDEYVAQIKSMLSIEGKK